ncbi:hypothetical protein [Succinimonas sp.]|uniref:hypothetical protein n=1 Tax=Succinimonas sp. TaxID=1936151 RepID=UPI00386B812A
MIVPNNEFLNRLLDSITKAQNDSDDQTPDGEGSAARGFQDIPGILADIRSELQGINRNLEVLVALAQGNGRKDSRRSPFRAGSQSPFFMTPGVREELAGVALPPETEPLRTFLNSYDLYIVSAGLRKTVSPANGTGMREFAGFIGKHYGDLAPALREIRRHYSADRYSFRWRTEPGFFTSPAGERFWQELQDLGLASKTAGSRGFPEIRLSEDPPARYFLTGGWLEMLAVILVQETVEELFEDSPDISLHLAGNLAVRSGDEEDFEMDVFFLLNGIPFWIECKTGSRESWQEDLMRYRELKDRYPILGRNVFLLSSDIEPECMEPLSRESGIRVADIPSFKRTLRDSVLSDIASGDMEGNPAACLRKGAPEPEREIPETQAYENNPGFQRLRERLAHAGIETADRNTIPEELDDAVNDFAAFLWERRSRLDHFDCLLRTALNGGDLEIPTGEIPDRHSLNYQFAVWLQDLRFISGYEYSKKKRVLELREVKSSRYGEFVSVYLWPAYIARRILKKFAGRDESEMPVILRRPVFRNAAGDEAEADLAVETGASWRFIIAGDPDEAPEDFITRIRALIKAGIPAESILAVTPAPGNAQKARLRAQLGVSLLSPEEAAGEIVRSSFAEVSGRDLQL